MALAAGARLGPYLVTAKLGEGGMGEVYKAKDTRLDRIVAIKTLPSDAASHPDARARFEQEAKAIATLSHPHVCALHDVGHDDNVDYLVMEYVDGETLSNRLRRGPVPAGEALQYATELADALDTAHRSGVIHRDLKPSNVMVTSGGATKVMDFGVAKRGVPAGMNAASMATMTGTNAGDCLGTIAYMSPEQLRGLPVDRRTDIFSFGVLLYEILTGVHPFARSTSISMIDAVLNAPAPSVSDAAVDVPPFFAEVVGRCLAKDPDQRYQSFQDVLGELRGIRLDREPAFRSWRPSIPGRRRWLGPAVLVTTLAAAMVGMRYWHIGLPITQHALAFQERDWIVIADFDNLTGEKVFDRSLRTALDAGLSQSQYVNVFPAARIDAALKRVSNAPAGQLTASLASDVAVREGARAVLACGIARIGDVYSLTAQLIDPQTRTPVRSESVEAKDKDHVLSALDQLVSKVRRNLGESLAHMSHQNLPLPQATTSSLEALKLYADSLAAEDVETGNELLRQAIALDPNFALARAELGRRYYMNSDRAARVSGEEQFVRALGLLDRLTTRERLWITATAEDSRGRRDAALAAYRSYLAQYPDDARGWFRVGWTQMAALGQLEPAIAAFRRVLAIDPADARARVNIATCYAGLHRIREAVDEYQKAFALRPELLTGEYVNHEYGFTLVESGELDRAGDVFRKMIGDPQRSNHARGYRSLALLDMYRGRYAEAIEELRKAIAINKVEGATVSEFRNRLFLVRALEAKGMARAVSSELAAADAIVARAALGPEWLEELAVIKARSGRLAEAKRLLASMVKSAENALTGSSTNRNITRDQASIDLVGGEIALAEGRASDAVRLFQSAQVIEPRKMQILDSLAAGLARTRQFDSARQRYEELIANRPLGDEGQELALRAHVRVGELYERLGRPGSAREAYQRLLAIWKDGDSDLVALKQAKARVAALPEK